MVDQVTMKDVAEAAGVSIGTVSNVLKGGRHVSLSTMQRVQIAIRKTGYRSSLPMRGSLKGRRTRHVGVILPSMIDPHYAEIFTVLDTLLSENGFTVSLALTSEIQANEQRKIEHFLKQNVEGIVIVTCQPESVPMFQSIVDSGTPLVFVEREPHAGRFDFVGLDLEDRVAQAVQTLLDSGVERPLLVTGPLANSCEEMCRQGLLAALKSAGSAPVDPRLLVVETNFNKESAFSSLVAHLRRQPLPDAILTTSLPLHYGAKKAVELLGFGEKPRFISMAPDSWAPMSIDDAELIRFDSRSMGEAAAQTMQAILDDNFARRPERKMLPVAARDAGETRDGKPSHPRAKPEKIRALLLSSPYSNAVDALLPAFSKRTGVEVEIEGRNILELGTILRDPAQRAKFDVFQIDQPWLGESATDNFLLRLDDWMRKNPSIFEDWLPGVLDAYCCHNRHYYTVPSIFGAQLLFYRKDLFDDPYVKSSFRKRRRYDLRAPRTWEEFNQIAEFFTRSRNPNSPVDYGTTLGAQAPNGALCEFMPRLLAFCKREFTADTMLATLGSPEAEAALVNYVESFSYAPPESEDLSWEDQTQAFSQGKAAMMILFTGHVTELTNRSKSQVVGRVGYEMVPGGVPMLGGWTLGVNKDSRSLDAALEFIAWTCRHDLLIPFSLMGGTQPSKKIYQNSELYSLYPWLPKAVEALSRSYWRNISKVTTKGKIEERVFEDILGGAVHQAVNRLLSPAQALKQAQTALAAMMI